MKQVPIFFQISFGGSRDFFLDLSLILYSNKFLSIPLPSGSRKGLGQDCSIGIAKHISIVHRFSIDDGEKDGMEDGEKAAQSRTGLASSTSTVNKKSTC
jgi:hypothetical protein